MQARKILLRITKLLRKAILGLVAVLIILAGIIHLPPVQKGITRVVVNYLSSRFESRVDIQRISFSILGDVAVHEITIWDPQRTKIFSAQKIEVASNIIDLLAGDFVFDDVHITGVSGHLIERQDGLNIQFILDAFKPTKKQVTTESTPINLQFRKILLENIVFEFASSVSGLSVETNLGSFVGDGVEFSTGPDKITANQVILQRTVANVLTTSHPGALDDTTASKENESSLDLGMDLIFDIKVLELKDDEFSFHKNQVVQTQKFDPSHITLKDIQLSLMDILIREDTIAAGLQSLAANLPGFVLTDAKGDVQLTRNQLTLSGLRIASGVNELEGDLIAPYDFSSKEEIDHAHVEITAQINPKDLSYFLSDSVMNQFNWGATALILMGDYWSGEGKIKTLDVSTGNSRFHAEGVLSEVLDTEKINWSDLLVNASIGSDFKGTLSPFTQNINLPPDVSLQLNSSGNFKNIFVDGKVFSTWGNVKARGQVTQPSKNVGLNIQVAGEKVDLGKWMNQSSLGPMDLSASANGLVGDETDIEINGLINHAILMNQSIHDIAFQSRTQKDTANVIVSIDDPNYSSEITSEILFAGPLVLTNQIRFDDFKLGSLLHLDTTLSISGRTRSKLIIDQSSIEGQVDSDSILLRNRFIEYLLDTLAFHALTSPTISDITYYSNNARAKVASNFDVRGFSDFIKTWSENVFKDSVQRTVPAEARIVSFNVELENADLIKLLGIDVDDFSSVKIKGEFDELRQTSSLKATAGQFSGYGISLDTLNSGIVMRRDSITGSLMATNLYYDSIQLGNLEFDITTKGDTATSSLLLSKDTNVLLAIQTRIVPTDSGAFFYTNKLTTFNTEYLLHPENSVFIGDKTIALNHLQVSGDGMQISLEGDLNAFDVSLKNVDLTPLNYLISPDTTLIDNGCLTGKISYADQQINLKADIDSLILYNSNPLMITATAVGDGNRVPFQFLLTNTSNKIDLKGDYFSDNAEVDAALSLDVNNPELFAFLVSGFIEEMKGTIKGEASISGPIKKPVINGYLQFLDLGLTTVNPRLTFNVRDDVITLETSRLLLDDFTLYDEENNPLTINGNLSSKDYRSFAYDLQINSDRYKLINNPDSTRGNLRGQLVIDSDIKLKGNERDTDIEAKLNIKDATDLTIVTSNDDIELLKAEGIIDFVDPAILLDSAAREPSANFYDSLIASLPDFNLNSTIAVEDNATFRVIIDEQSGDYIEASGGASLELGYDRTGNLRLSGIYTIKSGLYRLSFYDLVKKNFTLVQGSSINWSGSPENGDLNIKATHTVESNSLGLIGHEVGENEKSVYRRSLDYEVGININGTIERPIISFSLDLPQNDKTSYPVLANKLDRLRQPEYESELNKQVFGLLVLGGFIPETTGSDINSNLIATTALSNSVNSLLASQLNRFANQYIKGVNIDVGIQSYSDYSAPGGKTQTAMDFRVTKSMMNDRLSFEIGGDFDISQDQSGANTGKNYRGDIAIIYDLTGNGDKQLKLFNNETYDIIYQEIRNTGISLIFVREFERKDKNKNK